MDDQAQCALVQCDTSISHRPRQATANNHLVKATDKDHHSSFFLLSCSVHTNNSRPSPSLHICTKRTARLTTHLPGHSHNTRAPTDLPSHRAQGLADGEDEAQDEEGS
eukprot:6589285-Alexandrium_andersonii.AAC.2